MPEVEGKLRERSIKIEYYTFYHVPLLDKSDDGIMREWVNDEHLHNPSPHLLILSFTKKALSS
jgi:hypothetical protein